MRKSINPNERIRELEAELKRQRIEREANDARLFAELDLLRRQSAARKPAMPVLLGKLTQRFVNSKIRNREIGTYVDGGGLQLEVRRGAKPDSNVIASWLLRWSDTLQPGLYRGRSMGLGSARDVPLEDAREKALHYRRLRNEEGKDPKDVHLAMLCDAQAASDKLRTFEQVTEEYLEKKLSKRSPVYRQHMRSLLQEHILEKEHKAGDRVFKVGAMPIQKVTRLILLKDCGFEKLWDEHNPSAGKLLGVIHPMYGYAREMGYYTGDSPMAWRGGLEHVLKAPRDVHRVAHHPGLNYQTAPTFLQQHLRTYQYKRAWPIGLGPDGRPINCYMIELLLLTGTRVSEIVGARWNEIDLTSMTWTVPWDNTKRKEPGKDHRMPITRSMLPIIQLMGEMRTDLAPEAPVFPSHHKRWVQSHRRVASQTLLRVIKQLQPGFGQQFVNHGFRTTLKDWCRAKGYPDSWYDAQVHHKEKGKVNQAYGQDDLLEQRRAMMGNWDAYLTARPLPAKEADNVIELTKRRG